MAAAYRIGFRGAGRRPANSCCAWRAHYHVGPAPAQRHRKHGARGQTSRHCGTVQYIFRLRRNAGRVSGKRAFVRCWWPFLWCHHHVWPAAAQRHRKHSARGQTNRYHIYLEYVPTLEEYQIRRRIWMTFNNYYFIFDGQKVETTRDTHYEFKVYLSLLSRHKIINLPEVQF